MTALELIARFQPQMPEGIRFVASYPIQSWQDDEGAWHEPRDDEALIRVSNPTRFCDAIVTAEDLGWSDDLFHERILQPMLVLLSDQAEQRARVEQAFKDAGLPSP